MNDVKKPRSLMDAIKQKACQTDKQTDPVETTPEESLDTLCELFKAENKLKNELIKRVDAIKEKIKAQFKAKKITEFKNENVVVTLSIIDKSFLSEPLTLDYLAKNNLKKYIKTKKYFEPAELEMLVQKGEIPAEDLVPLTISKFEERLTVK